MIVADSRSTHEAAAQVISDGGLIAFRTDTFYGLGANPLDHGAVARIKKLKDREANKPILVLVSDDQQVDRFIAERSKVFSAVTERFWPGPLTVVGKAVNRLPEPLTAGSTTIGVRLPDDENLRDLLRACGGALTATSANLAGEPPARTAAEVASYFPESIDLIVDGGQVTATRPSTVLELQEPEPRLIREGAILREDLNEFLGGIGLRLS
jgi:L-threonylcarbamoyladenylate synthase